MAIPPHADPVSTAHDPQIGPYLHIVRRHGHPNTGTPSLHAPSRVSGTTWTPSGVVWEYAPLPTSTMRNDGSRWRA